MREKAKRTFQVPHTYDHLYLDDHRGGRRGCSVGNVRDDGDRRARGDGGGYLRADGQDVRRWRDGQAGRSAPELQAGAGGAHRGHHGRGRGGGLRVHRRWRVPDHHGYRRHRRRHAPGSEEVQEQGHSGYPHRHALFALGGSPPSAWPRRPCRSSPFHSSWSYGLQFRSRRSQSCSSARGRLHRLDGKPLQRAHRPGVIGITGNPQLWLRAIMFVVIVGLSIGWVVLYAARCARIVVAHLPR